MSFTGLIIKRLRKGLNKALNSYVPCSYLICFSKGLLKEVQLREQRTYGASRYQQSRHTSKEQIAPPLCIESAEREAQEDHGCPQERCHDDAEGGHHTQAHIGSDPIPPKTTRTRALLQSQHVF